MRNRLTVVLILAAGFVFSLVFLRQLIRSRELTREGWIDKPVRVLTYATMVSTRGPAEPIFKRFELEHHVKLDVVVSNDVGLMLERLKVGGPFDLVLGLDAQLLERARADFAWRSVRVDTTNWFDAPAALTDGHFVALDWSPLTFLYRADERPVPATFAELTDPRFRGQFTLSDPRATAPGLQFARWVGAREARDPRAWFTRFKPNVKTITPSWTAAYALFERRQTRFVWTYLTSLAFHWGTDHDRTIRALSLPGGHPAHVELAAIPADCRECALGETLLRRMLEPAAQELIMKRNFVMPVKPGVEVGTVFAELPSLELGPVAPASAVIPAWNDVFTN